MMGVTAGADGSATTTGAGRINIGFNATYLDLTRFRGLATDQMRFTFAHQDLNGDNALGGNDPLGSTEGDLIDVTMGTSIQAYIFALYGTVGLTSDLDVGFAVPFIRVSMKGTATAVISSYTFDNNGTALHRFGGTETSPVLETSVPYNESATGIGDVALRLKYCFLRGAGVDLGALVDVRIPTGKQEDFLGSKKTGVTITAIFSKKVGEFAPHLNVGYEVRSAEFQSSRVFVKGGFDQKLLAGLTFAGDFLGTFDTENAKAIHLSPGTASILDSPVAGARAVRTLRLSNIPDSNNDNLYNLSAGFRYAPSASVMFLANVLVPLNSGGLRAPVAPTLGFSVTL